MKGLVRYEEVIKKTRNKVRVQEKEGEVFWIGKGVK